MTHPSRERWLKRIEELLRELPPLHRDKAISMEAGRRAYLKTWESMHMESSTTVRDKYAKIASIDYDQEVIRVEGQIRAYEAELDILKFLINNIG